MKMSCVVLCFVLSVVLSSLVFSQATLADKPQAAIPQEEKPRDLSQVKALAQQGDADAQFHLGSMYAQGIGGVALDSQKAFDWCMKAANQDFVQAQLNMGGMYLSGEGVAKDDVQAHMWLSLAANHKYPAAVRIRDELANGMTAYDTDKAQKMAEEWSPVTN